MAFAGDGEMETALRYVEEHAADFVEELEAFCNQRSISPTGEGIEEAASLVASMLEGLGAHVEVSRPESGHPIVLGELRGRSPFTVLLYNHYDTLPGGDLALWDSDPFVATVRNGMLFARGVSDDKSDLLARIHCIRALQHTQSGLPVTIRFLFEGEEEIGSPSLPRFIENNRPRISADIALWEGGTVDEVGRPSLSLGTKGRLTVRLTARNQKRPLHTLYGSLIENPAWRLVWALASTKGPDERILIDGFHDSVEPLEPEAEEAIRLIPFDESTVRETFGISRFLLGATGEALKYRYIVSPHLTIGALSGGMPGVVPEKAEAIVAFGLVPKQDPKDIYRKLRRHLDDSGFADVESDMVVGLPPSRTPIDSFPVDAAMRALGSEFACCPRFFPFQPGASPSYTVRRLGIPCASLGSISWVGSNFHGPNENIRIADYLRGVKALSRFLADPGLKGALTRRGDGVGRRPREVVQERFTGGGVGS